MPLKAINVAAIREKSTGHGFRAFCTLDGLGNSCGLRYQRNLAIQSDNRSRQFYGNVELDVIQARSASGFDESLPRAVKKSCNVPRLKNVEFEGRE